MQLFGPSAVATSRHNAEALAQATTRAVSPKGSTGATGTGATGTSGSSATTANSVSSLTSEQTFLQLLVAQIQNQDPLNPTDSIQFVGQLVQYAELGQLVSINQGVSSLGTSTTSNSNNNSSARPAQGIS